MGTSNRITSAGDYIPYTPGSAVTAGDVIVQGDLVAVADVDIAASALGNIATGGTRTFPKAVTSGSAITAGLKVYWDVADQEAKVDDESDANKLIGYVVTAAADADTEVLVLMSRD